MRDRRPVKPKDDIHMGDHLVVLVAIAAFGFYIGYVYGAPHNHLVGITAAAHAVH